MSTQQLLVVFDRFSYQSAILLVSLSVVLSANTRILVNLRKYVLKIKFIYKQQQKQQRNIAPVVTKCDSDAFD